MCHSQLQFWVPTAGGSTSCWRCRAPPPTPPHPSPGGSAMCPLSFPVSPSVPHCSWWHLPCLDPLFWTLALLAMTMANTAFMVVSLDMAWNSFDDQYPGCRHTMTELLPALNHFEFQQNPLFAQTWVKAADEWWRRGPPVTPLSPAQAIALMTYTMKDVYKEFNAAVHVAGRSRQEYQDNFHFKTLHFLLIQALVTLRDNRGPRCHHVFRGVRGVLFKARCGDTIRFGRFTSTSLHKQIAQQFGTDTMFQVQTCFGEDIREFSSSPSEEEVLIPPFETFEVTSVIQEGDRALIQLRSSGTFSRYSCEWLRRDIMGKTWRTGTATTSSVGTDYVCWTWVGLDQDQPDPL
ncbi:erythroblast NAD(P)(+)--arginine ADP-ribosyltransferase-like [Ammospiza maritima maritima]